MILEIRTIFLRSLLILSLVTLPLMAKLFDSVPPEVNVILLGLLPIR